jgi:hypothetical protein
MNQVKCDWLVELMICWIPLQQLPIFLGRCHFKVIYDWSVRRVWRYQRGNQNRQYNGQKKKYKRTNNVSLAINFQSVLNKWLYQLSYQISKYVTNKLKIITKNRKITMWPLCFPINFFFFFFFSISQILFSKYLVTFLLQSPSSSEVSLWNSVLNIQGNTQNYNYI